MSKENGRRNDHVMQENKFNREKQKPAPTVSSRATLLSKHLNKVYRVGLDKTSSPLSMLSQTSYLSLTASGSSLTDFCPSVLEQAISSALRLISRVPAAAEERRSRDVVVTTSHDQPHLLLANPAIQVQQRVDSRGCEGVRRCTWITKSSDKVYVQFHDERWGVPVYDDIQLFELLALCGMLMDFNWTEILKNKDLFKEAFSGFEPNLVAKMGEKEIIDIASDKDIMLAENRVRCIVENAKCILKVAKEYGSFGGYMWGWVNYKPTINRYKHPRNVPLRTPKAEAISKDLLKHGFRLVGPVIVYSFMQAAGMSIDHLVDCFRFRECVNLAERPWRHV